MSYEPNDLTADYIAAYIAGEYLKDSTEEAEVKALRYCDFLIRLVRQQDIQAAELKANANTATQRAEEAEALLAASPEDTLIWTLEEREQQLRTVTAERDAAIKRAEAAERELAAIPWDAIEKMQGCEAHTYDTESAKIQVHNWARGHRPRTPNIVP